MTRFPNWTYGGARTTRAPQRHGEDDLLRACATWFRLAYPRSLGFHVPNGGKRDAREGARFKGMGVLPGIPDWFIDDPRGGYHGARIELKVGKNKPTADQQARLDYYTAHGYYVAVVWGFDEFREAVERYMGMEMGIE